MAFHLRSLSAKRYRIEGDLPAVHDQKFAKKLLERRFQPLSAHEERGVGWVTADNCLDTDLTGATVERGPAAVFALRIDRRRVNGRVLRAMMDLEMRGRTKDAERDAEGAFDASGGLGANRAQGKPPRRRVGREERAEIRRALTEELLRNTSPTMEVHPVVLYPRDRLVLFLSLSRPANEAFRALFADTFDAGLSALTPFHRAIELLEGHGAAEALSGVSRTEFGRAAGPVRAADEPGPRRRGGVAPPAQPAPVRPAISVAAGDADPGEEVRR
jgi:hypothetical protein